MIRLELNVPMTGEDIPPDINIKSTSLWSKPPPDFLKCNIGVSWIDIQANCGVAWVLRDDKSKPILHSRRVFSNIGSQREAEFKALQWAVSDVINTRQQRVMFESTCALARETFLNPPRFPLHQSLMYDISSRLWSLEDWVFLHCDQEKNTVAQEIAMSVTSDRRYQSYIASGGPSWLQKRFESEANN